MRFIYQIVGFIGIALIMVSCGGDSSREPLGIESALVQVPVEDRRIAIVHSQATKAQFYDPFAYNQLFASIQQQSMMAGIPFDLLDEAALATTANLLEYDAIVLPKFTHVSEFDRAAITPRLLQAQENGVAIMTSGQFMAFKPDGSSHANSRSVQVEVLGVQPAVWLNDVSASLMIADNTHPVSKTYDAGEELVAYDRIWFANFLPAPGEQSTALTLIESGGVTYNGAQIIERAGRVVHFANDQILADNNQLWRVIQWLVYGDVAPVSLQVSRSDYVFLARNDMDQAMMAADLSRTEIPLLEILKEWKRDYNFVGSFYIDIGNNPSAGEYTDWSVSGPLYNDYIALGNEIGTHSWTHPHQTRRLTASQLEFEFKDSAAEIGARIGVPVSGAAVPGMDESLAVVETLNPWLKYLSGRTGKVGNGFPGAFGFLEPQHTMMYFSLNMMPDYEAIDYLNNTPAQTAAIWKNEIDVALKHAQQPIVHWLWHDYGPTTQTAAGLYTKEMFVDTVAYASSLGAEFTTVENMNDRMRTFAQVELSVGSASVVTANVAATGVGQFALKISEDAKIKNVANWYAYDDDQVFLPEAGGQFEISVGSEADDVTRITKLPMRARLLELTGDGNQLRFTMQGEGEVTVQLSAGMIQNTSVTGADSFTEENGVLTLKFNSSATHVIDLISVSRINRAPDATGLLVNTTTEESVAITLVGVDDDGDALSYVVQTQPLNGTLTGSAPDLSYVSNSEFVGTDSFSFIVNDGSWNSQPALVEITVAAPPVPNTPPLANELILESVLDLPVSFTLTGSDNQSQPLTFSVTQSPANGVITGTVPNLTYTPNAGFMGRDSIQFVVNDTEALSEPGTVVFNVEPQLGQAIGTVTNPTPAILVDGDIADWATLTSYGEDPQDITGANNEIDWRDAWMAHDDTHFYMAYSEYEGAQTLWGNQIFLDTDTDTSTGFRGFANTFVLGADYLIEGNAIFRYNSTLQNQWAWDYLGSAEAVANGDVAELKIARAQLGNPDNLYLFFHGDSAATLGDSVDFHPDSVTDNAAVLRSRRFSYSVNPNVIENYAPIAFSQSIKITSDASYPLTLTGFDQDGDVLSFNVDLSTTEGTVTGVAPNLIYTPLADTTQDTIKFTVGDGTILSNSKTIQFIVPPPPVVNNLPAANNQSVTVEPSAALPVVLSGTDVDGDELSYRVVNPPVLGVITGTAPNLTYTAPATAGTDTFTYVANDGTDDSETATITVNIETAPPVNTVPVANSLSLTTAYETAIGVTLAGTDADADPLTYIVLTQPALGVLSGTGSQLTYVPSSAAVGTDTFTYSVNDGTDTSVAATVMIEVLAEVIPNRAPEANGQTVATPFATSASIVLSGRDPEQSALTFTVLSQPLGGSLAGAAPNLTYTPNADFSGSDSFTFAVGDGELSSVAATVTIDVGAQPSSVVSNPVTGITVDGALTDWSGLQTLGTDPADISGVRANNPLDWRQAWVAHSPTDLFIAFRNHDAFNLSWGHGIYIDVDGDSTTGFQGFYGEFPIGADYIIEANEVHQYTGTGNNWGWLTVGQSTVAVAGEIAELSLPRSLLNTPTVVPASSQTIRLYFRADNSAFGGAAVDHFPDAANDITAEPASRYLEYLLQP